MSSVIPPHNASHNPNITHARSGQAHVLPLFIDGRWTAAHGENFASFNPATGEAVWEGKAANTDDVHAAVVAARAAFPAWEKLGLAGRLPFLETFRLKVEANRDRLIALIAQENGKMLWDAAAEITSMTGKIALALQAYHERTGAHEDAAAGGGKTTLRHRPHGVAAIFGPYNFPGHLPNGHIVPALLAGNTVVFKPSDYTPCFAEAMVRLWQEAGLPPGVLNLVQGGRETGIALAAHSGLDGLFFTGSAATGLALHRQFAGKPEKMLALELGGNNPLIVHAAKDVAASAYLAIQSAFLTSGQRCTCARRLIVPHGKEGDRFLDVLAEMTRNIRVGAYSDTPEPFMGPMISLVESEKIVLAQEKLIAAGAKPIVPLQRLKDDLPFLSPGIVDVTPIGEREDTEFFGPLLQVIRVPDFDAALREANNTSFGLSAALVSDDAALFERFSNEIRAGLVNWNRPTTGASSHLPFGGIGLSGNHRASAYYSADFCAYPVSGMESGEATLPQQILPGLALPKS